MEFYTSEGGRPPQPLGPQPDKPPQTAGRRAGAVRVPPCLEAVPGEGAGSQMGRHLRLSNEVGGFRREPGGGEQSSMPPGPSPLERMSSKG